MRDSMYFGHRARAPAAESLAPHALAASSGARDSCLPTRIILFAAANNWLNSSTLKVLNPIMSSCKPP